MFSNILMYFGYILKIMFGTSFEILNISGSIGYPFKFGFGSDNTHNPKYRKTRSIRYLCRVRIGSGSVLSDRVRFGFSDSVYLPSPSLTNQNLSLAFSLVSTLHIQIILE